MRRRRLAIYVLSLFLLGFCAVLPLLLPQKNSGSAVLSPTAAPAAAPSPAAAPTTGAASPTQAPHALGDEYRAVWVSYLEWQQVDFSTAAAFRTDIDDMLGRIAALGSNVVLAQVRPFGDALYPSSYYPYSHLCSGVQGRAPGFDPLAQLVAAAHAHGLQIEAWCNPYRIQINGTPSLCSSNPAILHPEWVKNLNGDLYLDPANAEVQRHIAAAVDELCANYQLDGIHFDDYFYPTTDTAFDAEEYAAYAAGGGSLPLDNWRCENVNALLRLCHAAAAGHGVRFGVSPQGNPSRALATQYSDAAAWLAVGGYVDYLIPQLYWGIGYCKDGDSTQALENLAASWQAMPKCDEVALYFGIGAYRIGDGDGGDSTLDFWRSGHALADCAQFLRGYGDGLALYRYASLCQNTAWGELAAQEYAALHTFWAVNSA